MPLPLATKWELFEAELANTDSYLPILNKALAELENLIHCEEVKWIHTGSCPFCCSYCHLKVED